MEKPLDLSQREEMEMQRQRDNFMPSRDEPICQVTNCDCPLKHIMLLDSPKTIQRENSMNGFEEQSDQPSRGLVSLNNGYDQYAQMGACSSQGKRLCVDSNYNSSQIHPKRRRMEMYNKSMTKSSSNGDLISLGNANSDQERFSQSSMISGKSESRDYQVAPTNYDNSTHVGEAIFNSRERSMSMSTPHIQRLPKKRQSVRRISPETVTKNSSKERENTSFISQEISELASVSPHDKFIGNGKARPTCMTSLPASTAIPSSSATITKPQASTSSSSVARETKSSASNGKQSAYDLQSLKADMLREIDLSNEKGDEDEVKPQRGNIFFSRNNKINKFKNKTTEENLAPARKEIASQGAPSSENSDKLQSLDYMILTTLMQSEDQPFKARNNHIHEIIRGEKRGKLCLMDLVELQVEMGLA